MSEPSIHSESSSTAPHKRHASARSSIPKLPLDLIANLILPFVSDRATWNNVYWASKDLCRAGKKMTPPWPKKAFNSGYASVRHVAFSPSGSHLVFVTDAGEQTECQQYDAVYQTVVHILDRWGKETFLAGHTAETYCLEYSLDGEYLASGSLDGSIRLWQTESFHFTSSKICTERHTRTPKEVDIILLGSRSDAVTTLSFSRTDSNLLASGGQDGEVKLWNVRDQACIHSVTVGRGIFHSLFFAGDASSACITVTAVTGGSIIRLCKSGGSSDFTSETIDEAAGRSREITHAVLSRCGSFLATISFSYSDIEPGHTLALYDLETMTKTHSTYIPGLSFTCLAMSPESKQLVVGDLRGEIRLVHTDYFSNQIWLDTGGLSVSSVAFDPTCRVLAFGFNDGTLELRTL